MTRRRRHRTTMLFATPERPSKALRFPQQTRRRPHVWQSARHRHGGETHPYASAIHDIALPHVMHWEVIVRVPGHAPRARHHTARKCHCASHAGHRARNTAGRQHHANSETSSSVCLVSPTLKDQDSRPKPTILTRSNVWRTSSGGPHLSASASSLYPSHFAAYSRSHLLL